MIVIIGGGITGLASAYYLGKQGHKVAVYEKSEEIGGLAAPFALDNGALLEKYYHHFFQGQDYVIDLIHELGLGDDLVWTPTRMGFHCDGKTHAFSGAKDILAFEPIPFLDRLRFGIGGLLLSKMPFNERRGETPALTWLRKVCGPKATSTIWEPLLKMKFGTAYDTVSITWLQNRIKDRQRGRKGSGKEALGYLRGSIGRILDRLVEEIRAQGNTVNLGRTVEELDVRQGRIQGLRIDGEYVAADLVLATTPNPIFLKLASMLPDEDLEPLRSIRYQGTVCMTVKTRYPLTDFYWINVIDDDIPFVAAIEHTNFMRPDEYGGHLMYLGKYLDRGAPEWKMSPKELENHFLTGLEKLTPRFKREEMVGQWTFTAPFTQPVFDKDYVQPKQETAIPNLFLANTSMLFPESRTLNSSIELACEVNEKILAAVSAEPDAAMETEARAREAAS